ncbi:hypothetical protein BUALT_Bualt03G0094400 [Buddleja alternifolia]|uniref:X8 domain-containing protein n=1 Tax=Buddleja alternifolia TaxID=168488 RepID=A0AAV6Y0H5_9LAMI|nr:hypothetical protein BUALT_Bualt03G0094400 [Buddleja alternifolia]
MLLQRPILSYGKQFLKRTDKNVTLILLDSLIMVFDSLWFALATVTNSIIPLYMMNLILMHGQNDMDIYCLNFLYGTDMYNVIAVLGKSKSCGHGKAGCSMQRRCLSCTRTQIFLKIMHPVMDGPNVYYNAFDGNFDTLVSALSKLGFPQMPIVIGEIGVGPMDVYLFSLLDEGAKSVLPGNFERQWGIFSFDGQAKYPLNLGNGLLRNAKEVEYLPSRWCVANPARDLSTVANHFKLACSYADCTTLNYGGSCNGIGEKGNISYAFTEL